MKVEPITVLALTITGGGALFYALRWLWRRGDKAKKAAMQQEEKQARQQKDQALEKFRKIHAQARDSRKKLAQEIDKDPQRAAKVIKDMLKH